LWADGSLAATTRASGTVLGFDIIASQELPMRLKWSLVCSLVALLGSANLAHAAPSTGSIGWGFGISDPSGPFMTGYSDTGAYQENVYAGGGPIQVNQWQTLSYTVNDIHGATPTITVSVGGSPASTSNYNLPVSVPTDIFLVYGSSLNGIDFPLEGPIYVRDMEFKLDGVTQASEQFAYPSGTNLLSGSVAGWSDFSGDYPRPVQRGQLDDVLDSSSLACFRHARAVVICALGIGRRGFGRTGAQAAPGLESIV
jgi:hypothetical protein